MADDETTGARAVTATMTAQDLVRALVSKAYLDPEEFLKATDGAYLGVGGGATITWEVLTGYQSGGVPRAGSEGIPTSGFSGALEKSSETRSLVAVSSCGLVKGLFLS